MRNRIVISSVSIVSNEMLNKMNMSEEICCINEKELRKYTKTPKSFRFYSLCTKLGIVSMNRAISHMENSEAFKKTDEYDRGIIIGTFYDSSGLSDAKTLAEYINEDDEFDYKAFGEDGIGEFPPLWMLSRLPNTTAGQMAIEQQIKGLVLSIANGWSSSQSAIGEAYLALKQERAKLFITGGADGSLESDMKAELAFAGLLGSAEGGKPFSKTSDGYQYTSAAGTLILQAKPEEEVSGEVDIVGYSSQYIGDMNQLSIDELSKKMSECMLQAFSENEIESEEVGFIQASAGGHQQLDEAEAIAIKQVFGVDILVSCAQDYIGNTRAASGAISSILAYLQMKSGYIEQKAIPMNKDRERYCVVNSFSPFGELVSIVLHYNK